MTGHVGDLDRGGPVADDELHRRFGRRAAPARRVAGDHHVLRDGLVEATVDRRHEPGLGQDRLRVGHGLLGHDRYRHRRRPARDDDIDLPALPEERTRHRRLLDHQAGRIIAPPALHHLQEDAGVGRVRHRRRLESTDQRRGRHRTGRPPAQQQRRDEHDRGHDGRPHRERDDAGAPTRSDAHRHRETLGVIGGAVRVATEARAGERGGTEARRIGVQGFLAEAGERQRIWGWEATGRVGQGRAHGRRVGIPLRALGATRPLDDGAERAQLGRRDDPSDRACRERPDRRVGDHGHLSGARLDQDDGQRIQVGPGVGRHRAALLGRGVAGGAHEGTHRFGPGSLGERARQPEVAHPNHAMLVEQQVRRLDVSVNEPSGMRVLEGRCHLSPDLQTLRGGEEGARVEQRPQRPSSQQLDNHERHAVVLAPVVDRHDVRVVQRRRELRFGTEPPDEPGVVGESRLEHLDRDPTPEPHVVGEVDPPARAHADRSQQPVPVHEDAPDLVGDGAASHHARLRATSPDLAASGRDALALRRRRYPRPWCPARRTHPRWSPVPARATAAVQTPGSDRDRGARVDRGGEPRRLRPREDPTPPERAAPGSRSTL